MFTKASNARAALMALALLASAGAAGEPERLDDGRLDPAWFGPGVEFWTTPVIDYVWVKPGFSLKGKKLRIEKWPDPAFLGKERRPRDAAKAYELAEAMPLRLRTSLRHTLEGFAEVTTEGGDLLLSGRLMDYVAKGTMGKSTPQATWDIKSQTPRAANFSSRFTTESLSRSPRSRSGSICGWRSSERRSATTFRSRPPASPPPPE